MRPADALPALIEASLPALDTRAVPDDRDPPPGEALTVVNVSGGKDSTALYLLAVEAGIAFTAVFADTGHEVTPTLEHVAALAERTGGPPVRTVRADLSGRFPQRRRNLARRWRNEGVAEAVVERALAVMHPTGEPFLDLCLLRSGFPSAQRRFCTEALKIEPIEAQIFRPHWRTGGYVISAQGVRADESRARAGLRPVERREGRHTARGAHPHVYYVTRPLLRWRTADVFAMHERHAVPPNPLYALGCTRVGCAPCIFAKKKEIRVLAEHHPEAVDRVRRWEAIVSEAAKQGVATWFAPAAVTAGTEGGHAGIDTAVEWARTTRGGRQHLLLEKDKTLLDLYGECAHMGMCE